MENNIDLELSRFLQAHEENIPNIKQVGEDYYVIDSGKPLNSKDRRFVMGMNGKGLEEFNKALQKKCSEYFINKK